MRDAKERLKICESCPALSVDRCRKTNRQARMMARKGEPGPPGCLWPGAPPEPQKTATETLRQIPARSQPRLALVSCFFNPEQYRKPLENFQRYYEGLGDLTERLWICELSFDEDEWQLPEIPNLIRIRGTRARHQLWQKERLLNIAASQVPAEFDAIAWSDADHIYHNQNWLKDTEALLSEHHAVQCFTTLDRLGPGGDLQHEYSSWAAHQNGMRRGRYGPGGAWAFRRHLWPIPDYHILGGGDSMFLWTLQGRIDHPLISQLSEGWFKHWAHDGLRYIKEARGIGCTPGHVDHLWHGQAENRFYRERWSILLDGDYDPTTDIETDSGNGLIRWSDFAIKQKPEMIKGVADYFKSRDEDGKGAR